MRTKADESIPAPDEAWLRRYPSSPTKKSPGGWWGRIQNPQEGDERYVLATRDLERRRALADELEAFMQPRFIREPTLRDVLAYLRSGR
jgi:hypothetical protein